MRPIGWTSWRALLLLSGLLRHVAEPVEPTLFPSQLSWITHISLPGAFVASSRHAQR